MREMVARVIARSKLVGVLRNSVVFHILSAAADEDSEQYVQMANLRRLFDIYKATGSDLDDRAAEVQPAVIKRRRATFATADQTFVRPTTVGSVVIAAGTLVGAQDAEGTAQYRTQVSATILAGNTEVAGVPIVALQGGARHNVAALQVVRLVTRTPGVTSTFNPNEIVSGVDRESDNQFRERIVKHIQGLSRGTPTAVEAFATAARLLDGSQVLFSKVVEPVVPSGQYKVYIDDGTGTIETFEETFLAADDALLIPAVGGETRLTTTQRPIRDDGSFVYKLNGTPQVRGVDYELNAPRGIIELTAPLTAGDLPTANYRNYTGLIQEVQRVIDGDLVTRLTHPGVRASGSMAVVEPAAAVFHTLGANIAVLAGFDVELAGDSVASAILAYINGLDIGAPVIVAEITERAMAVPGLFNFQISDLSGTFPAADQNTLDNQVARITSASLIIT